MKKKAKHKVACLRQYLIDAIVGCSDVPLPPSFWPPKVEKPVAVAAVVSPSKSVKEEKKVPPKTAEKPKASSEKKG